MIGIIPAAGKGVRFKELGKNYAKTILPYKEKPILIHQIEWLEKHGCTEIRVVLNHQIETVKDILKLYNKDVTIRTQNVQNGLSGAIFEAVDNSDDDHLILLGDLIVEDVLLCSDFKNHFVSVQEVNDFSRWCMVKSKNNHLSFIDKPTKRPDTNLAVSGVYFIKGGSNLYDLLENQIFNKNKIAGEYQFSTVLQKIADKSVMNTIELRLRDFGTLEEYLKNRSVKNSRSFNDVQDDGMFITKSSADAREKIIKEYNWFNNLPDIVQTYTPRMYNKDFFAHRSWYKMEKVLAPSLRELYLFLDSSEETWNSVFNSMFNVLELMRSYGKDNDFMKSVVQKTKERVKSIDLQCFNQLYVDSFIKKFEDTTKLFNRPALMHGDFCFSNLLYDFQSDKIVMIDPRGEMFGDHYYEVAKIVHSIFFDYDFIDSELYLKDAHNVKLYNNGKEPIKELFASKFNKYYTEDEQKYILFITASLFLSMIPLHSHNRNNQEIYYSFFCTIYEKVKGYDFQVKRKTSS